MDARSRLGIAELGLELGVMGSLFHIYRISMVLMGE